MRGGPARRVPWALGVLTGIAVSATPVGAQSATAEAWSAYRAGRYDDAIARFTRLADRDPASADAVSGLVRALSEVGRYDEAASAARRYATRHAQSGEAWNALGEVLLLRGEHGGAERAFNQALAANPSNSLVARRNRAVLWHRTGRVEEALREFDTFIDAYNWSAALRSVELAAVATAVRYLGGRDPQLFKDAQRAYEEAIAADPDNLDAQVALGELFLEKYAGGEARRTLEEVLRRNPRHPRALLAMARTRRFAGSPEAMELVRRSLEVNARFAPARVFLATLLTESEQYPRAIAELERALEVNPRDLDALAVLAAIRYLRGETAAFGVIADSVLAINPRFADFYNTLAEVSARNRLYHEAVRFAREAIALDEGSWRGYALLGLNQLRIGAMPEGRAHLEISFRGDPYDVWTKNTLDLLDTLDTYVTTRSARFEFAIDGKEAALLAPYFSAVAEDAYDRLSERYGYRPRAPVRVEVYPSHADFSVRTVGLVGVGALGVSFGPVVAMDSPSARDAGAFNWASTLWHEIAHTFHLGMTAHRVPRWLSEGLAVFEERRARPGWGDDVNPAFLLAFRDGRLLPVSQLNDGFLRPAYPEQLGFSYYQASLVCELIEREHGPDALRRMLVRYQDGADTEEMFRSVLGVELAAFDGVFERYLRERFAGPLAALRQARPFGEHGQTSRNELLRRGREDPDDFLGQLALGRALVEQGQLEAATPYLERAKALFPEYAGPDSPYWHLARIARDRGELRRAVEELHRLTAINGGHYQAFVELAELQEALGNRRGAMGALEGAVYVYPHDMAVHRRLADLAGEVGEWELAVRERSAVVALDPVDRAEALYRLAQAHFGAGDLGSARAAVLQALEIAPSYAEAQDLLLEIHDARPGR